MKTSQFYIKTLSAMVLGGLVLFSGGMQVRAEVQADNGLPLPVYEFTFEQIKEDSATNVVSSGKKNDAFATIEGNGADLGIQFNESRDSKVLNLPGGGLGKGYLTLPEDMFEDIGEAGFTFSFWLSIPKEVNHYSRIFSASPIELNSDNGSSGWNAPEFTFVAGGTDNASTSYNSAIMKVV